MKQRLVLLCIAVTVLMHVSAFAKIEFHARFNPSMGYTEKKAEGTFANVRSDIRNFNPVIDFDFDIVYAKSAPLELFGYAIGAGVNVVYVPSKWKLSDNTGSVNADFDTVGATIGPKMYFRILPLSLYAGIGLGMYNTEASVSHGGLSYNDNKNSFGLSGMIGLDYDALPFLTIGGKAMIHYIRDGGQGDDYMIYSIGPSVGVEF